MVRCELILKQNFRKDCHLCFVVESFYLDLSNYVDFYLFATFVLRPASCIKRDPYELTRSVQKNADIVEFCGTVNHLLMRGDNL